MCADKEGSNSIPRRAASTGTLFGGPSCPLGFVLQDTRQRSLKAIAQEHNNTTDKETPADNSTRDCSSSDSLFRPSSRERDPRNHRGRHCRAGWLTIRGELVPCCRNTDSGRRRRKTTHPSRRGWVRKVLFIQQPPPSCIDRLVMVEGCRRAVEIEGGVAGLVDALAGGEPQEAPRI